MSGSTTDVKSGGPLRVLELYCGIGGCAAAVRDLGTRVTTVAGVDINLLALAVVRLNFPHPAIPREIGSLSQPTLEGWDADLWWLSPPCQPFTRRGKGGDDQDSRTQGLLRLLEHVRSIRPRYLALENVPEFAGSRTHRRLLHTLDVAGYQRLELVLCPSELGVPNRRRRFYLVAGREALAPPNRPDLRLRPLAHYLDEGVDQEGWQVPPDLLRKYARAVDVVDASDPTALTATFTSAYGRSPVRSGSYLRTRRGIRYFTPHEILALLGFPDDFRLPAGLRREQAWRLAGNSLSLAPVRSVLSVIPELR